jgi:squalene-hopene/tetraprenyl-beta-curcumene cyclase
LLERTLGHTAVPYALARPALRKVLRESATTDDERVLLENVRKRVRLWKEIAPVYNDKEDGPNKSAESRATEAVLLAFVLANNDGQTATLSDDTQRAFDNLWALQQTAGSNQGAWLWQLFDLSPWEGSISRYYGATLAAIAVGAAPENYRSARLAGKLGRKCGSLALGATSYQRLSIFSLLRSGLIPLFSVGSSPPEYNR